eukprot:942792-Prymnesium_polylepis.1
MVNGTVVHLAFWTAKTRIKLEASAQPCVAWQMITAFVCAASGMSVSSMKRSSFSSASFSASGEQNGDRSCDIPA